ncbi:MAG: UDP-N-acetylmuramoyl-L-alanyl-D-glutamate--2,6-diaminopimelate ligase [Planctomycetes bacterium]|nr:UDP-N-acetylmuramoyl-L-alanyl-D-glutamate--2,6-diaminopimelate ligase [Planctomycetota bacterium]
MRVLGEMLEQFPPSSTNNLHKEVIDSQVKGITHRNDRFSEGDVLVAFRSTPESLQGNPVLLCREKCDWAGPQIIYDNLENISREWAVALNQQALHEMKFLAVTGTNGKSTVVELCRQFLCGVYANLKPSSLGTLGLVCADKVQETPNTTLLPLDLHKCIREAYDEGSRVMCLEASSHGLAEGRLEGIDFAVSAFTNLSHDHLDYHKSMAEYQQAKAKLFKLTKGAAVINMDCSYMSSFAGIQENEILYSLKSRDASLNIEVIACSADGFEVILMDDGEMHHIDIPLLGRYNLENFLCAFGMLRAFGVELESLLPVIPSLSLPKGRLEKVKGMEQLVYIDYAHTPDALARTIKCLKEHYPEKEIHVLFGCGGERDQEKRPKMGQLAAELAHKIILTSDNSRGEETTEIMESIKRGVPENFKNLKCIRDREEAISCALKGLNQSSLLLLAGKGHELYQDIAGKVNVFDERQICLNYR